jgi:hypothetical protein
MIVIPKAVATKHWCDDYATLEDKAARGVDGITAIVPPTDGKGRVYITQLRHTCEAAAVMRPPQGMAEGGRAFLFLENW